MYPLRLYAHHPVTALSVIIGLALNLAAWGWLLSAIPRGGEQTFLHYTIFFGVDEVGPWYHVFRAPLVGIVVLCINVLLGWALYRRETFMAHVLIITAALVQALVLVSAALIVALNV